MTDIKIEFNYTGALYPFQTGISGTVYVIDGKASGELEMKDGRRQYRYNLQDFDVSYWWQF